MESVCSTCSKAAPAYFCLCASEAVLLCPTCLPLHCASDGTHYQYPMQAFHCRIIPGYFERLRKRTAVLPRIRDLLQRNLSAIDKCLDEFTRRAGQLIAALQEYQAAETQKLRTVRERFQNDIEEALIEAENTLYEDDTLMSRRYRSLVRIVETQKVNLFRYRIHVTETDLRAVLELAYSSEEKEGERPKTLVELLQEELQRLKSLSEARIREISEEKLALQRELERVSDSLKQLESTHCNKLAVLRRKVRELAKQLEELGTSVSFPHDLMSHAQEVGVVLPLVYTNSLRCFNLFTECVTTTSLALSFSEYTVFCLMNAKHLLCLGGKVTTTATFLLTLANGSLTRLPPTCTARRLPGLIRHNEHVYVFGGGEDMEAISACEKFEIAAKVWTALPDMKFARKAFTPCLFGEEIYLVDVLQFQKRIEAFNIKREEFRTLKTRLPGSLSNNSVSFIHEGELFILTANEQLGRWRINSESEFRVCHLKMRNHNSGFSSIPPMRIGRELFWINWWTGALVKFNIDSQTITE